MKAFFKANRDLWDQKTAFHKESEFYDLPGFLEGRNSLNPIELEGVGDVKGKRLLHLQCHFGQDSLSWARLGAEVTGVDFSPKALELARQLNHQLGLTVRFVESNVYELPGKIGQSFDIVFTSYGVLAWLPDLEGWAEVVDHYTKPGGLFYIAEFHPVLYMFDFDSKRPAYPYFNRGGEPFKEVNEGTYAVPDAPMKVEEYFWCHSLEEAIRPLLQRGFEMLDFQEFDYSPYHCFPNMEERAPGEYVYGGFGVSMPHMFSLKMRKKD